MTGARTYQFYGNGRTLIAEGVFLKGQLRREAGRLVDEDTRYIDVLDEGVMVARVERRTTAAPKRGFGR